jgi:uncharacterized RDD family membrane protein YckC
MRCPKCQYISFDNGERCRNCGYELSLTSGSRTLDLPIQTGDEPIGPLADLALEGAPSAAKHEPSLAADAVAVQSPRPITSSFDLPLFKERRTPDDAPRVSPALSERSGARVEGPPATPRPPLAVRRSTPTPPRSSNRAPNEPVLGFGFDEASPARRRGPVAPKQGEDNDARGATASLAPRLFAGFIDAVILIAISSVVLYLTLRVCGVPWSRVAVIPPVPFASFLLLIAGGYFILFTAAAGQTIGKMAAGIRVVPMDEGHGRVPLGHSVLRATAYAISALPVGLGFLPALVDVDKRAIHDRLADTRVVKA